MSRHSAALWNNSTAVRRSVRGLMRVWEAIGDVIPREVMSQEVATYVESRLFPLESQKLVVGRSRCLYRPDMLNRVAVRGVNFREMSGYVDRSYIPQS